MRGDTIEFLVSAGAIALLGALYVARLTGVLYGGTWVVVFALRHAGVL